jgi:hypothetical protein
MKRPERSGKVNNRDCKHGQLARSCEICELEEKLAALQNIIKISDERLIVAAKKASITYMGCDTPDALADEIVELREKAKGIEKVHALITSDFKNCFNSKEIDILKANAIKMWQAIKNFVEGK